ncbi:MAG TPA: type VI secretion system tip protein TssI/VgrG [Hyphomicrobiales bacterium]|nr:type VI secretion system tip protein TssI/VgrG [Hyphomicrobiales bacterium]
MAAPASQEKRLAVLSTPLGKDVLVLTRLEATEGLSELFEFRIDALSETAGLDFNSVLGRPASVALVTSSGTPRQFTGIATEAESLGPVGRYHAYRLVLRPWLWLLSQRANCRIFDKTVVGHPTAPEIIKKVFTEAGFSDFRASLNESYPELEYCVQYRETDLAFVCRLMEENGIYYFFEHTADKHTLVMADAALAHQPVPGLDAIHLVSTTAAGEWQDEHVTQWTGERRFRTGKVTLNDYDYLQPATRLLRDSEKPDGYALASFEAYDYPGRYTDPGEGERLAKVRVEAAQALDHRRYASGYAPSLFPGGTVRLADHPTDDGDYLVVRSSCRITQQAYASVDTYADERSGRYEFQPKDRQFRAPRLTPRPVIHGPQTAKVVGKSGEEIDVDEHGRILVQFYWDRDKKPSRRVRVAQMWSGKSWGGQFIPRINMEVVIEHLEGDPDQPLVVGTVYNGDNKLPYDLPANQTQAGVKSNSSKGGGGYNELMFEDKKSSEQIRVHAQKDLEVVVLNDESRSIGHDLTTTIAHAETRTVGSKFTPPTGGASDHLTLKNGDYQVDVESGTIQETAKLKITLQVGPSKLTIDPTGITLDAPTITIKSTGPCVIQGLPVKIN